MKILILLISLCFGLCACSQKDFSIHEEPVDFVAVTLGNAAEQAHSDLAMLAKLRGQGLQPNFRKSIPYK